MEAQTVIRRALNQGATPARMVLVMSGSGALMQMDSREAANLRTQFPRADVVEFLEIVEVTPVSLVKATGGAHPSPSERRESRGVVSRLCPDVRYGCDHTMAMGADGTGSACVEWCKAHGIGW